MPLFLTKPMQNCSLLLVEILPCSCYYDVENNSKGGTYMRKTYIVTLTVLSVMKKWGNFENSFSRFMGRKVWGIYLFHYLPLSACAWYLHLYISLPPLVMYLLVCATAFAGAIILYEIIRRIPVLKWCVCGIGGEK